MTELALVLDTRNGGGNSLMYRQASSYQPILTSVAAVICCAPKSKQPYYSDLLRLIDVQNWVIH
jgi:hypothetical protein